MAIMKNTLFYSILAAGTIIFASSCSDFLDPDASNNATTDEVYSDWTLAVDAHIDTYNFLRHGACRINNSWLDAATDLAETSYATGGVRRTFNVGNYYGTDGAAELTTTWEHFYRGIRKCNQTIAKLPDVPKAADITAERYEILKARYVAEAHVLRAYFYWELFLRYGPVPIVEDVLDPNDVETLLSYTGRPSVKEYVVDFILKEIATYQSALLTYADGTTNEYAGELIQPMASAMYAKIMLYMASPRYASASGITWNQAREAYLAFLNNWGTPLADFGSGAGVYSLMQVSSSAPTHVDALTTVWMNTPYSGGNTEMIFYRNDVAVGWSAIANDVDVANGGNGGCCPSQNLIDMYDMADGSAPFTSYDVTGAPVYNGINPTVNAASGYSDQTMWENRDPRLNATVLYHGVFWGDYMLDVRKGMNANPTGNANATPTGYYLRKYIPASILSNNHGGTSYRLWCFISYADMLLGYAEILNELDFSGNYANICAILDALRNRAGITGSVADRADLMNQSAMRNFIHKDRTVELAFTENRWWDLRRWNCATEALSRNIIGIEVASDGTISRKVAQKRIFTDNMYLYPIPESEYWKTGIENNPGWN
jgi:hypothetical protein